MSARSQYFVFTVVQILKLILFRRLRHPWMLALLGLVFASMSGAFASLGVPYLFWHDNVFARMFGLLGVGVFLEEWVFVALLLDTDSKNPAKVGGKSSDENQRLASQYYRETWRMFGVPDGSVETSENVSDKIFTHTRRLHTYATFSLCIFVSLVSYSIFSWNDLSTTWGYQKHFYMLSSGIYFPVVGAFLVFLVRKNLNLLLSLPESRASKLLVGTPWLSKFEIGMGDDFKRLHQIAFGKTICFSMILGVFCVGFWLFDASLDFTVPASIAIGCVVLLIYLTMLLKERENKSLTKYLRLVFTATNLVVFPLICFRNLDEVATSVALIASVLLTLFVGFLGWIVFKSRRPWFEYVTLFVIGIAIVGSFFLGRVPQVVDMGGRGGIVGLTPTEALAEVAESATRSKESIESEHKGWIKQFKKTAPKPILVVIMNSGGGIKAQVWSSVVINAIEKVINENIGTANSSNSASKKQFQHHVRLITGTSGGMVGASHWCAHLQSGVSDSDLPRIPPEKMVYDMSRDALDDVSRQMFYNDFIGLPYNIIAGERRLDSRGKGLERAFEKHDQIFEETFTSLKKGEDQGWRPILALAPTVAEDGRRFLICNQPIEYTLVSHLPCFNKKGSPVDSSIAGYSWRVNLSEQRLGGANELKISQAARLSANFPVFVDSPKLPYFDPPLRIMDAGYIDNYGVVIASQWLHHNLGWLKENTSKILVVQVSASPLERDTINADRMNLFPEPNGFMNASFNKTLHHTDMALARFAAAYDPSGQKCKFSSFEYEGSAALTWHLSNKEKFSLLYPFLSNDFIEKSLSGTHSDELDLTPLKISKSGKLFEKIIASEGKRFIARIAEATKAESKDDKQYLRQLKSRLQIRQELSDIQDWWFGD